MRRFSNMSKPNIKPKPVRNINPYETTMSLKPAVNDVYEEEEDNIYEELPQNVRKERKQNEGEVYNYDNGSINDSIPEREDTNANAYDNTSSFSETSVDMNAVVGDEQHTTTFTIQNGDELGQETADAETVVHRKTGFIRTTKRYKVIGICILTVLIAGLLAWNSVNTYYIVELQNKQRITTTTPKATTQTDTTVEDSTTSSSDWNTTMTGTMTIFNASFPISSKEGKAKQVCSHGEMLETGECICDQGFTGTFCETDINECTSTGICGKGGICDNIYGSYICICTNGYEGGGLGQPCNYSAH